MNRRALKNAEKPCLTNFLVDFWKTIQVHSTHSFTISFEPRVSLKNQNILEFNQRCTFAPWSQNIFQIFSTMPMESDTPFSNLVWPAWIRPNGLIFDWKYHFPQALERKCKTCFMIRKPMCISGEILGLFGFLDLLYCELTNVKKEDVNTTAAESLQFEGI